MDEPKSYSMEQIIDGIKYCKMRQEEARKRAEPTREKMMRENLALATKKRDKKRISGIKQIVNAKTAKRIGEL